jgi:hypothetical protein
VGVVPQVALAAALAVSDAQHGRGGGVEPRRGEKSERRESISYALRLSLCSPNLCFTACSEDFQSFGRSRWMRPRMAPPTMNPMKALPRNNCPSPEAMPTIRMATPQGNLEGGVIPAL